MEKRNRSYRLAAIQRQMMNVDGLRLTTTARRGLVALDFTEVDAVAAIQALTFSNFIKSMTCSNNHKIWQDVYNCSFQNEELYIKFQRDDEGYFTISFKEQ